MRKIALVGVLFMLTATSAIAGQRDPTQSRWYRATNWVDPTVKYMNQATSKMVPVSDPRYNAFRGGYNAGKFISERGNLGGRLYNRLEGRRR
jgi:hypothetical protein